MLTLACACALSACTVDVSEDGPGVINSALSQQESQPSAGRDCDPDDNLKRCKRDKDCPPGHYCAESEHDRDDKRGNGHDKHEHHHADDGRVCRPRDIDDGNPCTIDSVDSKGSVKHAPAPAGSSCEDGNACNGRETCSGQAQCLPGTPPPLSDDNPCTLDNCDAALGVRHSPVAAGTSCADQDACDGAETCDASGICRDGVPLDLDDHNPCTVDSCLAATGAVHTPMPAGTSCADADQCNGAEVCDGSGQCRSGAPSTSDDGNPCTIDACDQLGGVTHPPAPAGTSCDDGNPCNGHAACNGAGSCVDAAPPNVDDGNPCTADSCDPATGVKHEPVANGSVCGDTNPCNGSEACTAGVCQVGVAPALDDHNPCTEDRCDAAMGVEHLPLPVDTPCGDADVCNGTERCSANAECQAGSPAALDDGNPCTLDGCEAATGVSHTPAPAGTSCADANPCNGQELCDANGSCQPGASSPVDDANPCTVDSCAPDGSVQHAPVPPGTSCADGNPCNGGELCDAGGQCVAGAPPLLDDANPCTSDSCDPALGIVHLPVAAGSSCADADHCNGNETCDDAGQCQQNAPSSADDHNPCTIDACEPGTGITHRPAPTGTLCDDGNACDGVSTCDGSGQCAGGTAPTLDDLNPCTLDACDPQFGVLHSPLPSGTACSDGNACNGQEVCGASGSCEPGPPPVLDDGNPCTLDTCDPQLGVFALPAPPGTVCGDGNACNGLELCGSGGFCQPGQPPVVDDQNPCTLDSCTPDLGLLHEPLPAGAGCSNGDLCDGDELCDASGECHAGAARCDDGNACNGVERCNPDGSCSAIPHQLLVVTSPAPNALTREASVVVRGATHAVAPVVVTIAPGGLSTTVPGDSEPQAFSLTVPLVEGVNQLTVEASTEPACSASVALSVVRDSIAPALTLEAPERLALGEPGLASVTASDAGGVVEVRFSLKLRGEVVFEQARSSAPFNFDFTVPEAALAGDSLQLEAVALDQAGNTAQASRNLTLTAAAIVVGRVLSDATGQPLSASVRLDGSTAMTRPDGRYVFSARDAQVVVRAFRQGFTSVERKAPIQFGVGSVAFDARLTPLAEPVLVNGSDVSHGAVLGAWNGQPITATFSIPASAFAGAAALHVTPLSPQGLPGLLPPGWSPVAALETRLAAADTSAPETDPDAAFPPLRAPLTLQLAGLPAGQLLLVAYDRGQHAWRALEAIDAGAGPVTRSLAGLGVFALLLADPNGPALPPGGTLLADGTAPAIPPTAVAQGAGVPSSLSAGGGVTQGRVVLSSSPALASGALVSAALTESYRLSSGLTASTETTLQDLVLYRAQPPTFAGAPSGDDLLGAVFPIATSFSFGIADLTSGKLHLDVLAGREAHRGKIGGHAAVVVEHSGASFAVVENSLEADTLIDLERSAVADFLIRSPELVPLAQLALDLSGSQLSQSGELRLSGLSLPVEETPLLTRLERVDGVAYPSVVALGNYDGSEWSFTSGDGFTGILKEGTYVVYRATLPLGFVAGTARAGGAPVQALVSAAQVPFVAVAGIDGSYQLPVLPGAAALTARITGTNLVARGEVAVTVDHTSPLDLALVGELTTAVVSPLDGAVAVPRTTQLTLSTPVALDPATLTEDNIRLFAGEPSDNVLVDIRLQISANARSVAVIPELRLAEGADYTLQASGLRDAQGGLVVVPITSFRTVVEVPDVVDTDPIEVTLPEGDSDAHVVAPPGSLDPGSTVLITNEGNGHVVSCSVGNGGGLDCEIPASIDDTLVVSITTPDGATRTVRRSQYTLPNGRTAVGAAGGIVTGPGGVELRIPEGAIPHSVVFKLTPVDLGSVTEQPTMPGSVLAGAMRVETEGNPVFAREIDLAFPKPTGAPEGAFYFVHRRLAQTEERPLSGGAAFEVIDHAFVQGSGLSARVVTASCPFPGFSRAMDTIRDGLDMFSLASTVAGVGGRLATGLTPFLTNAEVKDFVGLRGLDPANIVTSSGLFLLTYTYNALAPTVPDVGLIRGTVQRAKIDPQTGLPGFEPIAGAEVTGADASGQPFVDNPSSNQAGHVAYSQAPDGKFTLWDTFPTQGQVRICARLPVPGQPDDVRCVTPAQQVIAGCGDNTKYYRNQVKATITFPALPAVSAGDSSLRIQTLREVNGARQLSDGLFTIGQRVLITFSNEEVEVRAVDISQQGATQSLSVRRDPLFGQPLGADQLAEFVPAAAGTFTITALAQPVFPGPTLTRTSTFRVVAAGGDVTTPVPDEPPRILDARTVPSDGSDGIHPSVHPQFVFTEPVKNVPANVELSEDQGGLVEVNLIGIGLDGLPVTLLNNSAGAQKAITALTIEPKRQLKFGRKYLVALKAGIFDLDNTLPDAAAAPRPLVPYAASFTTLQPQALTDPGMGFSSPGIVSLGDRAYVVENNFINGVLRVFDISDPASPTEISSAARQMAGRPMDLDVQDDGNGGANVTVVTGPADSSFPSNLRVYNVPATAAASPNSTPALESKWIAGATLTSTAAQGIVRRVATKGDFAYALTTFQGVQVVDLAFARQLFDQGGGDTSRLRVPFNTDGQGFGHEAVVATIPVLKGSRPAFLTDLQVGELVDGIRQPLVVATGDVGLAIINPQTAEVLFNGGVEGTSWPNPAFRGQAVALTKVENTDIAVVVGRVQASGLQTRYVLYALDVSNPRAPTIRGEFADLVRDPSDVVLAGGFALAGSTPGSGAVGGEPWIAIINLQDPSSPWDAGTIEDVAGRLEVADSGVLLATAPAQSGGTTFLGGLRAATLGLLPALSLAEAPVSRELTTGAVKELETIAPLKLELNVFGAPESIKVAEIQIRAESASGNVIQVLATHVVQLVRRAGALTAELLIPRGFRVPKGQVIKADASVDLHSTRVPSAPVVIDLTPMSLRADENNDTAVDSKDDDDQGTFAFWAAAKSFDDLPQNDWSSDCVPPSGAIDDVTERDLIDWATIQVAPGAKLEPDSVVSLQINGNVGATWFLAPKVGNGKMYLADRSTAVLQLQSIRSSVCRSSDSGEIVIPRAWLPRGGSEFLVSCSGCTSAATELTLRYAATATASPEPADFAKLEIQPLSEMVSIYSARRNNGDFSPLARFIERPGSVPLPADAKDITVIVHGFNVSDDEAVSFVQNYTKRLYWVHHPVLGRQDSNNGHPWVVGISWPGDSGGWVEKKLNLPDDEFHGFQTGESLARLIQEVLNPNEDRSLDIIAHSLGNLVVNTALLQPSVRLRVHTYTMNEAAVPAEAFGPGLPLSLSSPFRRQAEQQGYPHDALWVEEWNDILRDHESNPRRLWHPNAEDYCQEGSQVADKLDNTVWNCVSPPAIDDYEEWSPGAGANGPSYAVRWTKYSDRGNRPWLSIFADNVAATAGPLVFNTYNPRDAVVNAAWVLSAGRLKPDMEEFVAFGAGQHLDDRRRKFWLSLKRNHTAETRTWAELAYYFGPLSPAAGGTYVPEFAGRNHNLAKWADGAALHDKVLDELIATARVLHEFPPYSEELCTASGAAGMIAAWLGGSTAATIVAEVCSHSPNCSSTSSLLREIAESVSMRLTSGHSCNHAVASAFQDRALALASHGFMLDSDFFETWCAHELFRDLIASGAPDPTRDASDPKACKAP